jgi:hypothetical protein
MSPNLPVKLRQLTPSAHGTQLDTIHKLGHIITSVLTCPTTLLQSPELGLLANLK